jgi:hypothetical protein
MSTSARTRICLATLWMLLLGACRGPSNGTVILLTPSVQEPGTAIAAGHSAVASAPSAVTCLDLDASWGDWPVTLDVLTELIAAGESCGPESLWRKLYAAHFNYGMVLEGQGDTTGAIAEYQAAFELDPRRQEALEALARLGALPEPTPPACASDIPPNPDPAPTEVPDVTFFVRAEGDHLLLDGEPFYVRGVNYYPRHAPWHRFLEQADPAEMAAELDLIQAAGFNTLRVFLWYDVLFICEPEHAIPNETGFATVDELIRLARDRNLRLIVTLNDLPDLHFRPLYTDWARYDAQTIYIVRRYRNEPAILAWDLRNEGDLDYGARGDAAPFSQEEVMTWLAHISQLVRENDPYHLITAGWWGDPGITAPYVDVLSFHHWGEADELAARIEAYRQYAAQPLLLQEVGYHSWAEAPQEPRDAAAQADILGRVIATAEEQGIAGWLIWTAFDFAPEDGAPLHYEHFFGLWTVDLTPKPALEALPLP